MYQLGEQYITTNILFKIYQFTREFFCQTTSKITRKKLYNTFSPTCWPPKIKSLGIPSNMVPKSCKPGSLYLFSHFCPYGRKLVVVMPSISWILPTARSLIRQRMSGLDKWSCFTLLQGLCTICTESQVLRSLVKCVHLWGSNKLHYVWNWTCHPGVKDLQGTQYLRNFKAETFRRRK